MQPSPRAETSRLLFPSLRFFIVPPRQGNSLPQFPAEREIRRSDWRNIALVLKNSLRRRVFPQGSFFRFVFFFWYVVAYALAIAGCAFMLRNRTSRFRFCATAAR